MTRNRRRLATIKLLAEQSTEMGSLVRAETNLERVERRATGEAARARAGAAWVAYHRGLQRWG